MAFWNKFPYSNFHEINLDWIIREMKKISVSVSDFARQWEKALKQETGERQEADRQLQENIDAEQARAEAAEEALDQKIEAETSRAEAAEEALDQKIEAETTRATEAEEALDQKIEAETTRATEAEEALDQKIEAETARATAKENDLQGQITAEVNRATAAEGALDGKITAETARATGVENELRGLINTETERATAAEGALGDRIDGLEGELEGVTGADSPFIRKDGTTTTTGKIPLAMGGTSEVDPAAATDLVNLRSMQAADQALESSMTEYVDNQLEAAVADVHSIPAGGTAGQVLGKVDGTDYNVQWVDQTGGGGLPSGATADQVLMWNGTSSSAEWSTTIGSPDVPFDGHFGRLSLEGSSRVDIDSPEIINFSDNPILRSISDPLNAQDAATKNYVDSHSGSDPDAIKKDGSTITTARIPFAQGISLHNGVESHSEGGMIFLRTTDGNRRVLWDPDSVSMSTDDGGTMKSAFAATKRGPRVYDGGTSGKPGQVLTAKGDGTCEWADGGLHEVYSTDFISLYSDGIMCVLMATNQKHLATWNTTGEWEVIPGMNLNRAVHSETIPDVTIPENYRPKSTIGTVEYFRFMYESYRFTIQPSGTVSMSMTRYATAEPSDEINMNIIPILPPIIWAL